LACLVPMSMAAQDSSSQAPPPPATTPHTAAAASSAQSPSKWDLFAGYSYLAPKGNIINNGTITDTAKSVDCCVVVSLARYFSNYVGVQVEGDFHKNGSNNTSVVHNTFAGGSGGVIFRYPTEDITPFVHALVGGESVSSTYHTDNQWGVVITAGGGLDYNTPWLNHRFSIRIFQADYQYAHVNMFPVVRGNFNMARLSTGLVFSFGSMAPPAPVTLACSANPTAVFPGEPVTITATAGSLNPKEHVIYGWTGQGVTGTDTTAKVDTTNLAPGSYTVNGTVKTGKPGKEGLKPWQSASCSSTFTVKEFEPPTLTCSANPTTIKPGESSTITATGTSPQNRPLTYSYQASAGTVSGTGTTATFASTGAQPGPITVTCSVSDDKGHTATATTSLNIEAPPPPPQPPAELERRLRIHSVFFPTDLPRETHPEGGLVESQQATLTTLATDFKQYLTFRPDTHLILTGHADPRGGAEYNQKLSERRVERVKQFLVDQGVPGANIDTKAVGEEQNLTQEQVKDLVQKNPDLSDAERKKILAPRELKTIVLAQNRRVDITLSTTGQQSNELYPFNVTDAETLLNQKAPPRKHAPAKKKK
jgi:outer membrane protein OmpA-like peptidoglycan-associated protein